MRRIKNKGGIIRALLLSAAMFTAGYLTAVYTLETSALDKEKGNSSEYSERFNNLTSQIKDMVKEHGSKAYGEISEYLKSLQNEKEKKDE